MKILIISDSHGHIANLKTVLDIAKKSGIKAVIHCGDWDNLETFNVATSYGLPIYTVLGNADVNSDLTQALQYESDKFDSNLLSLEIEGIKMGVIHHLNFKDERLYKFKVVFYGHKHTGNEQKVINFTKFVFPGALINGINFAVYETITGEVDFVENQNE